MNGQLGKFGLIELLGVVVEGISGFCVFNIKKLEIPSLFPVNLNQVHMVYLCSLGELVLRLNLIV